LVYNAGTGANVIVKRPSPCMTTRMCVNVNEEAKSENSVPPPVLRTGGDAVAHAAHQQADMPSLPFDTQANCQGSYAPHKPALQAGWQAEDLPDMLQPKLGALFKGLLRIRFIGESILTRSKFAGSIEQNSCCYCIKPGRPAGQSPSDDYWLEITPSIAFPMINCLLGGPSDDAFILRRPFTAIERRVLARPVGVIAAVLRQACLSQADYAESSSDSDSDSKAIIQALELPITADPDAQVALAAYELTLDSQLGMIRLCQAGLAQGWTAQPVPPPGQKDRKDSPMEISAILAETPIDPRDIEGLAMGDIITTDCAAGSEVIIRVAGIPKFVGKLGICNGHRAVTILRRF
jgi:flagellar motor switch protein FliM